MTAEKLKQIEHLGKTDYIMHIFRYVINAGNVADPDALIEVISENLSPTIGEKIMTPAQHWEARGEVRGEIKGLKKARTEIAAKLLQTQLMPLENIAELTSLSIDELVALKKEIVA